MHKKRTRLLSLLLVGALLLGLYPLPGLAEASPPPQATQTDITESPPENEAAPSTEPDTGPQQPPADSETEEPTRQPTEEAPPTPAEEPVQEPTQVPSQVPSENPAMLSLLEAMAQNGYAYVLTSPVPLYATEELTLPLAAIAQEMAVLLVHRLTAGDTVAEVWLLNEAYELVVAYVPTASLPETALTGPEVDALAQTLLSALAADASGQRLVFVAALQAAMEEPTSEPTPEDTSEGVTSQPTPEPAATATDVTAPALPTQETPPAEPGAFAQVTTQTNAFTDVDESFAQGNTGELWAGYFTRDAIVQVEEVLQDGQGRWWYRVRYLYGDDFADGTLKWTAYGTACVLAAEAYVTDAAGLTVTDYAYPDRAASGVMRMAARSAQSFSLKALNAAVPTLYVGQSGLYGSSGKDSAYLQIAKAPGHGTVYATPHYLEGYTVYCLEHTLPGPGENISGGGQQPTGPYVIVDMDTYRTTPGYSSIIYHESTLHAIGWVLRHTYPFMVLDRSDADNETWSRVAGQFAIRQVIRELEGPQYVRDYWDMDNFYRASGQAPEVYLEYARWLAANGIARASMTGAIAVSNQSARFSGGYLTGTVTLTTDADLIRIPLSAGALTGNTAGTDGAYYYLRSGDTVSVTVPGTVLSFVAESVSSAEEEANFLIGVPDEAIQKVLIPQQGAPYKLQSVTVAFDAPMGGITVTKKDAATGAKLPGAVFELSGNGESRTQTTGADGMARFENLQPGVYTVREIGTPEGYLLASPDAQQVTVAGGGTASAVFANAQVTGSIRIVKRDSLTKEALAGAEFTITRLTAPPSAGGAGTGSSVVVTTDASGIAETGWLPWGRYRIEETKTPEHYVDQAFSTEIDILEQGKTYEITVENEPAKGYIQIVKTDSLDKTPIGQVQFDIFREGSSEPVAVMTTDENGAATSPPLPKGSYIVREHENPTGYVEELVQLSATVKSDATAYLSASNQPIQGRIRIVKRDSLTKEALAGAEFTITRVSGLPAHQGKDDGEVVAVLTTDAEGVALSPPLTYGTYRVEESKVPEHYVDQGFAVEVEIRENGKTYEIAAENEPTKGYIRITKTDRLNGNPIAGVRFDIYENDAYGSALAGSMVTDENGVAVSEPLRKGRYIVREYGETAGYVFEEIALEATVQSDMTTELTATNQPVQVRLKLYKRDAEEYAGDNPNSSAHPKSLLPEPCDISAPAVRGDGQLTGAVFQVLAAQDITDRQGHVVFAKGEVVADRLTTAGADASVTTELLWPGVYEIVELSPPEGYQPSGETFLVDARSATEQSKAAVVTYEGLKTNKIRYGAQAVIKILGSMDAGPDPGRVETPEAGAEFNVYLERAGSYENAREIERDHLVTDENGYAKTKPLPYGVYVLEQTKGAPGYEIKGPVTFEIDGTEDLDNPPPLTLSDQPIRYRLRLLKTDAETGRTIVLSSASFKLKNAAGEYVAQTVYYPTQQEIDTFVTDETGGVTLPETVTWGLYYLEEVKAPEGYLLPAEDLAVFVGQDGDSPGETYQLDIEIPNTPVMGRICLEKTGLMLTGFEPDTDAYGNKLQRPVYEEGYLAGAVFEVRAAETVAGKDGTVWFTQDALVSTLTTTAEGMVVSEPLPLGRYYLVETQAPAGYALDETRYDVTLAATDSQTTLVDVQVKAGNAYIPVEITVEKQAEALQSTAQADGTMIRQVVDGPGEGFVFGLYNAFDIRYPGGMLPAGTLVATGATDAEGRLTFAGNYPHGDYEVRELQAPEGWKRSPERFPIMLVPEGEEAGTVIRARVAVRNALIYTPVTLTKTDITGANTVPGALIEVRDESGAVIYRAYTDERGELPDIPVTPGRYTFREVLAPEGYALNEAETSFTVDAEGNVRGNTLLRDDFTRVQLQKQYEDGQPMGGVTFALLDETGTQLMTAISDRNGLVTFERIPYGSYTIVETQPLPGYFLADVAVELQVDGSFVNPKEPLATIVNHPMRIACRKVNPSGTPLPGAEFCLVDAATGTVVEIAVSDEEGCFAFEHVDYGDWIIRERKSPEGYSAMADVPLHIGEDFVQPEPMTFVDIPDHYVFRKVDTAGRPLAGVRFALEDAEGNALRELVSGEDGTVRVDGLEPGSYVIRETQALEGYTRTDETLCFTLDASYVPAEEMPELVNATVIQTGIDLIVTPLMTLGGGLVLLGCVLYGAQQCTFRRKRKKK